LCTVISRYFATQENIQDIEDEEESKDEKERESGGNTLETEIRTPTIVEAEVGETDIRARE
jgi:hypothetical protein